MSGNILTLKRTHKTSALVIYTPLDRFALLKDPKEIPEIQQDIEERKCHPTFANSRLTALALKDIFEESELRNEVNAHVYALGAGLLGQVWFYGGGVSEYTKLIASHAMYRSRIVCFAPQGSPQQEFLTEMLQREGFAEVRG